MALIMNVIFFTMEMQYVISRKLVMTAGGDDNLGSVEIELLLTLVLAVQGFLTPEFFLTTVSETFMVLEGVPVIGNMKWATILLCTLLPL